MVIKNPKHPYTRLLIDSIPWPNIKRRWGNTEIKAKESELAEQNSGCKFASRCPFVFWPCKEPPPLFRVSEHQAASCFLFEENPRVDPEKLTELLPV
jgi:peptide/nickel transport system ATP-binding protein